jgi:hypothetical protein
MRRGRRSSSSRATSTIAGRSAATGGPTITGGTLVLDKYATAVVKAGNADDPVAYSAALNPATFTISGWFKRTADAGATEHIINSYLVASTAGYRVYVTGGDILVLVLNNVAAVGGGVDMTVAVGSWHHFVATYDGTTAQMYLNGVAATNPAAAAYTPNPSAPVHIGSNQNGSANFFTGEMQHLRVRADKVATLEEAQADYAGGRA